MLDSFETGKFEYQKLTRDEQKSRGILGRLVGVIADTANPTRNGRLYGLDLWNKVFENPIMKERIANRCCFSELGHPADRTETDMEKVAACLAEVPKKGSDGKLYGVFDILSTPNGKILKSLCDYGCTVGVSSRGSGDTFTNSRGEEEVDASTYDCQGFDIVIIPAVEEARVKYVTESLDKTRYNKTLRQSLTESLNKASEEDKKIMEESLKNIGINLTEEVKYCESCGKKLEQTKDGMFACPDCEAEFFDNEDTDDTHEEGEKKPLMGSLEKNESLWTDLVDSAEWFRKKYGEDVYREYVEFANNNKEVYDNLFGEDNIEKFFKQRDSKTEAINECSVVGKDENGNELFKVHSPLFTPDDAIEIADDCVTNIDEPTVACDIYDNAGVLIDTVTLDGRDENVVNQIKKLKGMGYKFESYGDNGKMKYSLYAPIVEEIETENNHYEVIGHNDVNSNLVFRFYAANEQEAEEKALKSYDYKQRQSHEDNGEFIVDEINKIEEESYINESEGKFDYYAKKLEFAKGISQRATILADASKDLIHHDITDEEFKKLCEIVQGNPKGDITNEAVITGNMINRRDIIYFLNKRLKERSMNIDKLTYEGIVAAIENSIHDSNLNVTLSELVDEYLDQEMLPELPDDIDDKDITDESLNINEDYFHDIEREVRNDTNNYKIKFGSFIPKNYEVNYINDLFDEFKLNGYNVSSAVKDHSKSTADLSNYNYEFEKIKDITDESLNINEGQSVAEIRKGLPMIFTVNNAVSHDIDRLFGDKIQNKEVIEKNKIQYTIPFDGTLEALANKMPSIAKQIYQEFINHPKNPRFKDITDESLNINNEENSTAVDNNEAMVEELQSLIKEKSKLEQSITKLQEKLSVCYTKEAENESKINSQKKLIKKLTESSKKTESLREQLEFVKESNNNLKQSSAKLKEKNENLNSQLVEAKSLIRANKVKLNESISSSNSNVTKLNEELKQRNSKIRTLTENLNKLNEDVKFYNDKIKQLNEDISTLKKDNQLKQKNFTQKLDESAKLVEKYKSVANQTVNKYISEKAITLGVSEMEIKNRLPESYNIKDIDTICEGLQSYKINMNNLPFDTRNMSVKFTPSTNESLVPKNSRNDADDISEFEINLFNWKK